MDKIYFSGKGDIHSRKKRGHYEQKEKQVNVIYGDKNLKDCMEQVIQKHERSFDFLTLIS